MRTINYIECKYDYVRMNINVYGINAHHTTCYNKH